MDIRPLSVDDITDAMALSTQVGWNQIPADWRRLIELAPNGTFCGVVDGELVATTTLITYDGPDTDIGWIGMVLVDEDHRRNGYGGTMVDHVLTVAEQRDIPVGLDATDSGSSLYRPRGFTSVCPTQRWYGTVTDETDVRRTNDASATPVRITPAMYDDLFELDRAACGVDRQPLLTHLLDADRTVGLALRDEDGLAGYAIGRPGREYAQIGPIVASTPGNVTALLTRAADAVDQDEIIVDLLDVDRLGTVLGNLGLDCDRRLSRMTAPEPRRLLVGPDVVAATGFEFG